MSDGHSLQDIEKAIRQRNAESIMAILFDESSKIRPGYMIENELWDYKVKGPELGAGTAGEWAELAKDVLAFHNYHGGIIIFGVDNRFQTVGHSVRLDSKLINDRVRKYIGDKFWLDYHRFNIQADQLHIGLLLVPPRGPVVLRFQRDSPCENGRHIFKKGNTAFRVGDSSKVLHDIEVEALQARVGSPGFGQIYAIDEPFFRVLNPEYRDFVERAKPCEMVEKAFHDTRTSVIQLTGIGGVGKTALATWAVLQAYERKEFQFIVSTTAKDRELTTHGIQPVAPKLSSFEGLLNSILDVLRFPDLKTLDLPQREREVKEILKNSGGLLFVDNLETVDDSRVVSFLDDLPVGVRAIVTSRRDTIRVSVFPIALGSLESKEAVTFIRSLSHLSGLEFLNALPEAECGVIRKACDGLPLAIRWTVSRSKNASEAIKLAESITHTGKSGEELLEFSFRRVYDSLNEDERALLQVLSLFQHPQPSEVLYVGSNIAEIQMEDALGVLQKDALVQRFFDDEKNDYTYSLLPLTRKFVYTRVRCPS